MGQAAVESEAETLHRAPQIQPWIPGRGAGGGALGSFTENFGYIFPLSGFGLSILVFRQLIMMCSFDFPYV